jgi:hypothetical protein
MGNNTVVDLNNPEKTEDVLTEVLRQGARRLLAEALWR